MDVKTLKRDIDLDAKPVKVNAILCSNCKDYIYSRAHHDYHYCTCGGISVDGGFDYMRFGWDSDQGIERPTGKEIIVDASKRELYDDWNRMKNKFGTIKDPKVKKFKKLKKRYV